jgi:hypothetical protein
MHFTTRDVSKRCGTSASEQQCDGRRCQSREEYRHCNSYAAHGIGEYMQHDGDRSGRNRSFNP